MTSGAESKYLLCCPAPPLGGRVQEPTNQKAARWHWLRLTPHIRHSGVPWPRPHRALWLESLRCLGPGSGFGSRGIAEEVSESCARAEESAAREGMTGGGDDAMFGNRCPLAHAQGTSMVVGGAGGGNGGERKKGGAPAPSVQRPQRLSFLNLSAHLPSPLTYSSIKDSHFPRPLPVNGHRGS